MEIQHKARPSIKAHVTPKQWEAMEKHPIMAGKYKVISKVEEPPEVEEAKKAKAVKKPAVSEKSDTTEE